MASEIPTLGDLLGLDDAPRGRGVEVWYQKEMSFHGFTTGRDPDFRVTREELERTHVLLGCVAAPNHKALNIEKLWQGLQGEFYSPGGEARALVRAKGLHHTSMSVGDFFVLPDGRAAVVAFVGFRMGRIER